MQNIVDSLKIYTQLQNINYENEAKIFFSQCSKNDSKHTQRQYKNGLSKLEAYLQNTNINILKLTPSQADDFCIGVIPMVTAHADCGWLFYS